MRVEVGLYCHINIASSDILARVWPNFGVVKMMNSSVYIVNECCLLPCFLPYQPVCFTITGHIIKLAHHVRIRSSQNLMQ